MLKSTSNLSQQFCQWFYIERKLFTTYVVQQLRVLYGLYLYCTFVPANIGITNPLFNQSLIFNWLFMFSVWYTYLQLQRLYFTVQYTRGGQNWRRLRFAKDGKGSVANYSGIETISEQLQVTFRLLHLGKTRKILPQCLTCMLMEVIQYNICIYNYIYIPQVWAVTTEVPIFREYRIKYIEQATSDFRYSLAFRQDKSFFFTAGSYRFNFSLCLFYADDIIYPVSVVHRIIIIIASM